MPVGFCGPQQARRRGERRGAGRPGQNDLETLRSIAEKRGERVGDVAGTDAREGEGLFGHVRRAASARPSGKGKRKK